jgi:hypothetical protein
MSTGLVMKRINDSSAFKDFPLPIRESLHGSPAIVSADDWRPTSLLKVG